MSANETLLVEIGTEELPPKALPELAQAFATHRVIAAADKSAAEYRPVKISEIATS